MVLGKLPVPGRSTIWITVGQGPTALAVGAGGGCLNIFLSSIFLSYFSLSWERARYRLKYCLKGPFNPKQPSSQPDNNTGLVKVSEGSRPIAELAKWCPKLKVWIRISP